MITAKWIWKKQVSYKTYNQKIIARKNFNLPGVEQATIRITADSFYRLFINGEWVNDGPCRSWPEHFQYDELDVTSYLKSGQNQISIIAWHWGVGTFHNIPQQAGLLAQLDAKLAKGNTQTVITDSAWEVSEANAWIQNVPKVSIQMEPQEYYDARLENSLHFTPAEVLFDTDAGPWKNLNPRDVALLTKKPFSFKSFRAANLIKRTGDLNFCVPTARLVHPDKVEANHNTGNACGLSTVLELKEGTTGLTFLQQGFRISIDGQHGEAGHYKLAAGKHIVLAFVTEFFGHNKEKTIRIIDPPVSMTLINPINPEHENPWCWIPFPEFVYADDDINWSKRETDAVFNNYNKKIEYLSHKIFDVDIFRKEFGNQAECMPSEKMFVRDTHWQFTTREALGIANELVENPSGLMHDTSDMTVVRPSEKSDVELIYDLGEQNCGYYDIDLIAEEGVEIDIYGVEYIDRAGMIQHTGENRNGMRYITKAGVNRFVSLKRRAGRFLFITFRNQKKPVRIRKIQLIESTYPVNYSGSFHCSDVRLDRIREISARTLKLCMEDTFTDCPLFEQTLWVGDARNEAVFAYPVFGATDIGKRCITLAAQSLERFPIVGCQVPSSWECLLPAWSFLWGISVWDYYEYSGDEQFLREIWEWVVRNLKGAEKFLDERNLFSAPFWNLFDWADIDDKHSVVLHNSMLLVGAIDAATKCAYVIGDETYVPWLKKIRSKLRKGINNLWDPERKAYRDSVHADGKLSASISQHTGFLSILYDIVEPQNADAVLKNLLDPPDEMVQVGSPFAMMYYYEALEKAGSADDIIQSIYECYLPMLEDDATTVWETFARSKYKPGEFPTRSHCHAWSSAPLYFLNRIILGIKQTVPGGKAFEISPRLNGLSWAKGAVATPNGELRVSWQIEGKKLNVKISAPEAVQIDFRENETHKGLQVRYRLKRDA